MTAIACFVKGNDVILYADTLVSCGIFDLPRVPTPAHNDINTLLEQKKESFRFSGHKQKLCILGRSIVIAFAGSEAQARDVAETLLPYSDIPNIPIADIDRVLNNIESYRISKLSFIMVHHEFNDGFPELNKEYKFNRSIRWRNVDVSQSEKFDLIIVGGSATDEILSDFNVLSLPINMGDKYSSQYNSSMSIKIGYQLAHGIVLNEYFTGSNYASRYGGIVEVCDFFYGIPNKNITTVYLFFHIVLKDGVYILGMLERMGVQYYKDEKLYHVISDRHNKNAQRSDCIIVDEIFENVSSAYVNEPSDETVYAIGVWVPFSGEKGRVHFLLSAGDTGIERIVKEDGEVMHGVKFQFVQDLAKTLSEQFDTEIVAGILRHASWGEN